MVRCPTEVQLEQLLAGALAAPEEAHVRQHAGECPTCAGWIDRAQEDELLCDHLGELLRDVPAQRLGRYRLLGKLGEGGMGVVYEAEQDRPRRRVALKVLRPGLLTAKALRRLELEAEVLGRLEHPGIARIFEANAFRAETLDASAADASRANQPFFAMELVRGRPLDHYVRDDATSLPRRLELVARVADAVEHAHSKGVLHRDLKPSNVLVNDEGEPRVLDFGIARTFDAETTEQTVELAGTPAFMAPEQLTGDPALADTRADVYALGALLYVVLADRLPIDLAEAPLAEVARRVVETEPVRLGQIDPALGGDIEIIAAKALAKEPERRYASAAALADDLRRVLAHQPILARRPSATYVLTRFVRRHRWATAFALAAVLSLVGGTSVATWQAVRARRAESLARTDSARLAAVNDFLQSILGAADPLESSFGADPSLRLVLDDAARRLEAGSAAAGALDPRIEADLRLTIGRAYRGLGERERAAEHVERAAALIEGLADAGLLSARAWAEQAALAYSLADYELAAERFEVAVELHAAELGSSDPRTLRVRAHLGATLVEGGEWDRAEQVLNTALSEARAAHGEIEAGAETLVYLARIAHARGEFDAARATAEEALRSFEVCGAEDSIHAWHTHCLLSVLAQARGDAEGALAARRRALEITERRYGKGHRETADDLRNVAITLADAGESRQSLDTMDAALRIERSVENLIAAGRLQDRAGQNAASLALYDEALERVGSGPPLSLEGARAAMGSAKFVRSTDPARHEALVRLIAERMPTEVHPRWAVRTRVDLGRILERRGELAEAESWYRAALALPQASEFDPGSFDRARLYLATLLTDTAPVEATTLFQKLVDDGSDEPGALGLAAARLGWLRLDQGQFAEAIELQLLALERFATEFGEEHDAVAQVRRNLACALVDAGRGEEACPHFEAARSRLGEEFGASPQRLAEILERYRGACP